MEYIIFVDLELLYILIKILKQINIIKSVEAYGEHIKRKKELFTLTFVYANSPTVNDIEVIIEVTFCTNCGNNSITFHNPPPFKF